MEAPLNPGSVQLGVSLEGVFLSVVILACVDGEENAVPFQREMLDQPL